MDKGKFKKNIDFNEEWLLYDNKIKELIKYAEKLVKNSISGASPTSIRRVYNPIVKIKAQASTNNNSNDWERELTLLKPRIVYLVAREGKLRPLKENIIKSIECVENLQDNMKKKQVVLNFCHFMEAVVAYHKQYNSKK